MHVLHRAGAKYIQSLSAPIKGKSRDLRPGEVPQVLILAYQRSGSTFFGQVFGGHDESFYVYEPLDGLYVSLYGTRMGWNVPADITNYRNGTER